MSIESIITDDGAHLSSKLMEISFQRQNVIANNLANSNTPGYIRKEVQFQDKLAALIDGKNMDSLDRFQSEVVDDLSKPARLDGNNVDGTGEMSEMMQNSVLHNLLTRAFSTKMKIMEQAISR